ncbi:AAA family ATPase [Sunxiuqinia sp. sy24]|uniref:AAA family ATPase n=1 Tax=Sunxiuqinia sp. sy24 TaxID=3461495 RepID=UPI0040465592
MTTINNSPTTYTGKELLQLATEDIPWLLEPVFPKTGLVAIAGSSDTGKSTLMRQLCIAISNGESEFLGFKLNSSIRNTIYVSTEDGKFAVSSQLNRQNKKLRLDEEVFKNIKYIFSFEDLTTELGKLLAKSKNSLIVVDALADIYGKDMNQSNQVRGFLNEYSQLAEKHDCLIAFVHHTGKSSEFKMPNKNNLLGSQGIEAKMRTVAILLKDKKTPNLRHLCFVKGNYMKDSFKNESFTLQFDENMLFSFSGDRDLIENLALEEGKKHNNEQIFSLSAQGFTQSQIATKLNISQSSVSRTLNNKQAPLP